jgi:Fe-S cluster biogenesis protein NfuA
MEEKIRLVLERVKPFLKADGGDVELVEVQGGVAKVRLTGACGSCPMATVTLRNFVERTLKEEVPEIKAVVAV